MRLSDFKHYFILLVALSVAGWAGEARSMGVEVNGERLAVIDMHLHTGTWAGTPPRFRNTPHGPRAAGLQVDHGSVHEQPS